MMRKILLAAIFTVLVAGCSTKCILISSEYFDITGEVFVAKDNPEDVQVLTEEIDRPYKEIGMVRVLARYGTDKKVINREMARRAAQAGADAVIEVKYGEDRNNEFLLCGIFGATKRNITAVGKAVVFTAPGKTGASLVKGELTVSEAQGQDSVSDKTSAEE